MTIMKNNLCLMLYGFEKDPGDALVIEAPLHHSLIEPLQILLQDDLIGYDVPITKEYEREFAKISQVNLDTEKLDFFVTIVSYEQVADAANKEQETMDSENKAQQEGKYPAPRILPAFPDAVRVKGKTRAQEYGNDEDR